MKIMDDSMAQSGSVLAPLEMPGWKSFVSGASAVLMSALFLVAGLWKITDAPGWLQSMMAIKRRKAIDLVNWVRITQLKEKGGAS